MHIYKFGGTSLGTPTTWKAVANIIQADPKARAVVVSAPGKSPLSDAKVTDLLLDYDRYRNKELAIRIIERFEPLASLAYSTTGQASSTMADIIGFLADCQQNHRYDKNYIVSRGEYWTARLMAEFLGWKLIDAKDNICLTTDGRIDVVRSFARLQWVTKEPFVMPGFYGAKPDGAIECLSRGGSDTSGAILALALRASEYYNFTDTDGVARLDPKILPTASTIPQLSFAEMEELGAAGAGVFHHEAAKLLGDSGAVVYVKNTFNPNGPSTKISNTSTNDGPVGLAVKNSFSLLTLLLDDITEQVGVMATAAKILADNCVPVTHFPSAKNELGFVVNSDTLNEHWSAVWSSLTREFPTAKLEVQKSLATLTVAGEGMRGHPGTLGKITTAIGNANINIVFLDQGGESTITIGVNDTDVNAAARAVYATLWP